MTITDPKKDPELLFLISPWAFGHYSGGGPTVKPFQNAPFHKTKKGMEELKGAFQEAPDPGDHPPIVCFASSYYTLVPEDLYEEDDRQRMMKLTFSEDIPENELRTDRSMVSDARIVHWWPPALSEEARGHYPGFFPEHFAIRAIDGLLALNTKSGEPCAIAHIRHGEVDIGFAAAGRLRSLNSFSYANTDELVYFILHAWRTYASGERIDAFHVTGTTEQGEEKELLQRYVEDPIFHMDGKGNWCSFVFEDILGFADHRRST